MKKITTGAIITEPGSSMRYKTGSWKTYKPVLVEKIPPCVNACPAGIDVRGFIRLIKDGRFKEALDLIKEKNPLPATSARICHHPCEEKCNREKFDEPIAIRALRRFVADYEIKNESKETSETERTKEERIAVVGSGPAGLSAAYKLAKMGYSVTVFEASPVAGGMLRVGVPDYRLPKDVLKREIDDIESLGVEMKLNTPVTDVEGLLAKYNAIFIAVGAQKSMRLNIPGEELDGVIHGLDFLRALNLRKEVSVGNKVAVIGGGNVAVDVARSIIRMGSQVSILYRRSRKEMPAIEEEIEEAEKENVQINYLVSPKRILGSNKVSGVECLRMKLGEPDESGRRRPIPIEGSEFVVEADTVIPAIGQYSDLSFLKGKLKTEKQRIIVNPKTFTTDQPGIFAGGDVVTGPATLIEAIAVGMKAAVSIDRYLRGEKLEFEEVKVPSVIEIEEMNLSTLATESRINPYKLSIEERKGSFKEVNRGFTEEEALEEAGRCLSCGLCDLCQLCRFYCPDSAVKKIEEEMEMNLDYCKGCGICANECKCGVIEMELEER